MGLARVPFERGEKAKHQNKQISVAYRANLKLADLLKVPNNAIKCIYSEIQGT